MTKDEMAEALREVGYHNDHGISADGGVYVSLRAHDPYRGRAWLVHIHGKAFKEWRDEGGGKPFRYHGRRDKAEVQGQAVAFAEEFSGKKMVRSPFGNGFVQEDKLADAKKKAGV